MSTESITLWEIIPSTPREIYDSWLSSTHGKMTGSNATVDPRVGGSFTAWDNYISGTTQELEPYRRIVQAWRTTEFPQGAPDSRLEVLLEQVEGGTRITIRHTEIPEGQGSRYEQGWIDFYFRPMKEYFARRRDEERRASIAQREAATAAAEGRSVSPLGMAAPQAVHPATKPAKKAAKKPAAKKPAKKPAKKAAKKAARKAARKLAARKPAAKKAARKAKKPAKKATKKVARKPAKKPVKKPAKKAAKKAARKPAKKAARKAVKKAARKAKRR